MTEFELNDPPKDAISAVRFNTQSARHLLASSWDAKVRLYDIEHNQLRHSYEHDLAVLDCCYVNESLAFSGGLDKTIKSFDFESQKETIVGTHNEAVSCVHYSTATNLVISGSWDKYIKLWDTRSSKCVGTYEQPDKVRNIYNTNKL